MINNNLHLALSISILLIFINTLLNLNGFILMIPLYNEKNSIRVKEYMYCLEKNSTHGMIEKIHVIYDMSSDDNDEESVLLKFVLAQNLQVSFIEHRPTYQECFTLANALYPNQTVILSNADIFFNETLYKLKNFDLKGKFIALTRYNILKNGALDLYWYRNKNGVFCKKWAEYSQDVWIFQTPLSGIASNISIGSWNCDSRLAFQIAKANLKLLNPCLTIQCCHLHLSEIRHYEKIQTSEPCLSIPWTKLS